jgi:hypothetical protein
MPLIKKRDVKNYFAARRHTHTHPQTPERLPDAAANAGPERAVDICITSEFAEDFREEHSSPGKTSTPPVAKGLGPL